MQYYVDMNGLCIYCFKKVVDVRGCDCDKKPIITTAANASDCRLGAITPSLGVVTEHYVVSPTLEMYEENEKLKHRIKVLQEDLDRALKEIESLQDELESALDAIAIQDVEISSLKDE